VDVRDEYHSNRSSDSQFQCERLLDVVERIRENPSTSGFTIAGAAARATIRPPSAP